MSLTSRFFRLAIPNILTNITVPLLGMVDLSLAGHLGEVGVIGGISIATTIFNLLYWSFGFLRMGTTALTAQAHGAVDLFSIGRTLLQSLGIALLGGVLLILFQSPLLEGLLLLLRVMDASPLTTSASEYFYVVIWGAPAVLMTYTMNGWLIGMHNSWYPMTISWVSNGCNILLSLFFVLSLKWGLFGIALGTVLAQWIGAVALLVNAFLRFGKDYQVSFSRDLFVGLSRYFHTNIPIFARTFLLISVSSFFTYAGTQMGALTLAVNVLLYQFFTFFSYFTDGFAYAGEAMVGYAYGQQNRRDLTLVIKILFKVGFLLSLLTALFYYLGIPLLLPYFTNLPEVQALAINYLPWIWILPIAGILAFVLDGVFVGLTKTTQMMVSMLGAALFFFACYYYSPFSDLNHTLWCSFIGYLAVRGLFLLLLLPRNLRMRSYYIGIGSTYLENEKKIKMLLRTSLPFNTLTFSSFYESDGVGCSTPLRYLNAVVRIETFVSVPEIVHSLKEIEREAGRTPLNKRDIPLDLDLVLVEEKVLRPKDFSQSYFQKGYQEVIK